MIVNLSFASSTETTETAIDYCICRWTMSYFFILCYLLFISVRSCVRQLFL